MKAQQGCEIEQEHRDPEAHAPAKHAAGRAAEDASR
jgi:hypothetical protein